MSDKFSPKWLVFALVLSLLLVGLVPAVSAQDDDGTTAEEDEFPVAVVVEGTVDEVGEGTVTLDGVIYTLGEGVDAGAFVVGEPIQVTVLLGEDATMTVIALGDATGDVEPVAEHPVGLIIAEALGVPYEDVMGWAESDIGFGEIARAYLVALEAGVDVMEILARRIDEGLDWCDILAEYGLEPSAFTPATVLSRRPAEDGEPPFGPFLNGDANANQNRANERSQQGSDNSQGNANANQNRINECGAGSGHRSQGGGASCQGNNCH